jgi:hypothetical protein
MSKTKSQGSPLMRVPEPIRPYVKQLILLHQIGEAENALEQIRSAKSYQQAIAKIPATSEAAIAS